MHTYAFVLNTFVGVLLDPQQTAVVRKFAMLGLLDGQLF